MSLPPLNAKGQGPTLKTKAGMQKTEGTNKASYSNQKSENQQRFWNGSTSRACCLSLFFKTQRQPTLFTSQKNSTGHQPQKPDIFVKNLQVQKNLSPLTVSNFTTIMSKLDLPPLLEIQSMIINWFYFESIINKSKILWQTKFHRTWKTFLGSFWQKSIFKFLEMIFFQMTTFWRSLPDFCRHVYDTTLIKLIIL